MKLISLLFSFQKAKLFQYFKRLMEYPFHKPFFTDVRGLPPARFLNFCFSLQRKASLLTRPVPGMGSESVGPKGHIGFCLPVFRSRAPGPAEHEKNQESCILIPSRPGPKGSLFPYTCRRISGGASTQYRVDRAGFEPAAPEGNGFTVRLRNPVCISVDRAVRELPRPAFFVFSFFGLLKASLQLQPCARDGIRTSTAAMTHGFSLTVFRFRAPGPEVLEKGRSFRPSRHGRRDLYSTAPAKVPPAGVEPAKDPDS